MWLAFLAMHLVGLVGYSLLLRKSLLDNVDRWFLATVMQTAVVIPILGLLLFERPDLAAYDLQSLVLIAAATALVILLHLSNVKALQYLEASVYSILFNLRILFATVLGVLFLNEAIIPLQLAGGALIFLAVLTVRQKGGKKLHVTGIKWGLTAAVVISALNAVEKDLISTIGFIQYAVPVMILSTVIMWAVLLRGRNPVQFSIFLQPRIMQLMVLRAMSAYGFMLALLAGGLLSVSSYVSSLGVIGIVVLGVLLLGERDYLRQKIIATALAVAGLTAILIANL